MQLNKIEYRKTKPLFFLMLFALGGLVVLKVFFSSYEIDPNYESLKDASVLAQKWFNRVIEKKDSLKIYSDSQSSVPNAGMIGDDYTVITTTLGSLESKELSTNPDFASVILKMFYETGLDSSSTIGLTISGSFPSLAISTLAAASILRAKVVILSSLGASGYGANQPGATWINIESWLRQDAIFNFRTTILTMGAENDNGEGLIEEALEVFESTAKLENYIIYKPDNLEKSIEYKVRFLKERNIDLLVNIGGNQAAVGNCVHTLAIPNGLNDDYVSCEDDLRGIIPRIAETGIPFIHLLNIKDLAVKVGIPLEPGNRYGEAFGVYYKKETNKVVVIVLLSIILVSLIYIKYYNYSGK